MRHAGGELAYSFEPLHLAQCLLDPFAFRDLGNELAVGGFEFARAFGDTAFQRFVELAQLQAGVACLCFTFMQRFKANARFVLPPPSAQRGLHDADERRRMERPF